MSTNVTGAASASNYASNSWLDSKTTFSPNYNTITVVVRETKHDSMTRWKEPHSEYDSRPLNQAGKWPITGGVVAAYRSMTGIVDLICGIAKLFTGRQWHNHTSRGALNIIRAAIEVLPTAVPIYMVMIGLGMDAVITCTVMVTLAVASVLSIRDWLSSCSKKNRDNTTTPVTVFYDDVLFATLQPTTNFNSYDYSGWLREVNKYGEKEDRSFV